MHERRGAFFVAPFLLFLPALLIVLAYSGLWYAADRGIPPETARGILPAFLLEVTLYILSGLKTVRDHAERASPFVTGLLLTLLAPVSWLLLTAYMHSFELTKLLALTGLAAAVSFWYVMLPRHVTADLGFLVVMAGPVLGGAFDVLYPDPARRLPAEILGLIMWYRTGLVSVLAIRRMEGVGFGFIPGRRDWAAGILNYLWFLPLGIVCAFGMGFARLRHPTPDGKTLITAALTFIGVLLVLAVAEELFFRGLLQQQLSRLFRNESAGLLAASLIFGAAHLGYRQFPNWKFAFIAALAGIFYGRAYLQAGSIRAAMVTHALVVTTWRVFLT